MKKTFRQSAASLGLCAVLTALSAYSGIAAASPAIDKDGVLANKEGRTLYIFDKDSAGKSNCNGGCAAAWPPFAVANPALAGGDYAIVTRDDGSTQWSYQGKPLYFYAADAKPGDRNGDKQGGVWHIIPTAKKEAAAPTTSAATYRSAYSY